MIFDPPSAPPRFPSLLSLPVSWFDPGRGSSRLRCWVPLEFSLDLMLYQWAIPVRATPGS
uniref:Uncharacterized protein n=1 Tax=Arundo donax TaxID=35708 RepID=A0A0A9GSF7_ARUDO